MDEPGTIQALSPTALAAIRRCGLAVYRRRTSAARTQASNPVARLGNAAHRVLEWVADNADALAADADVEGAVRRRWENEVAAEQAAAASNDLEASFGPPERWPRFATIQEGLVVDGAALAAELRDVPAERRKAELRIDAPAGDIFGTIDLVVVDADGSTATVIDHKAGSVKQDDIGPGGRYRTQVLLYSALVRDRGLIPRRAEIRSLGGGVVAFNLDEAMIDEAVTSARRDLSEYNKTVMTGDPVDMARPSEKACEWCEFLLDCRAVWGGPEPDLGDLEVVEGTIVSIQARAGKAALRLAVPGQPDPVIVSGLSSARSPVVPHLAVGDTVRVAGLRRTARGMFKAGLGRLSLAKVDDLK